VRNFHVESTQYLGLSLSGKQHW